MPGESGVSRAFRDLRRLGWECEFKTDRVDAPVPYLFQRRQDWERYRKLGGTWLQHNGVLEDAQTAKTVLEQYCSRVVYADINTPFWVER